MRPEYKLVGCQEARYKGSQAEAKANAETKVGLNWRAVFEERSRENAESRPER